MEATTTLGPVLRTAIMLLVAAAGACALVHKTIKVFHLFSLFIPSNVLPFLGMTGIPIDGVEFIVCCMCGEQSEDGDVVDCVDMYHQPALKQASPGNRNIQVSTVCLIYVCLICNALYCRR